MDGPVWIWHHWSLIKLGWLNLIWSARHVKIYIVILVSFSPSLPLSLSPSLPLSLSPSLPLSLSPSLPLSLSPSLPLPLSLSPSLPLSLSPSLPPSLPLSLSPPFKFWNSYIIPIIPLRLLNLLRERLVPPIFRPEWTKAPLQVWQVWYLGLVTGAAETALLMVLARVAACVWGENYWLMGTLDAHDFVIWKHVLFKEFPLKSQGSRCLGSTLILNYGWLMLRHWGHSGVFLAMVILVGYVTVDMLVPAPDSPKASFWACRAHHRTPKNPQSRGHSSHTNVELGKSQDFLDWSHFQIPFRRQFQVTVSPRLRQGHTYRKFPQAKWGDMGRNMEELCFSTFDFPLIHVFRSFPEVFSRFPQVRRQRAAAQILQTLQAKMAGGGAAAGGGSESSTSYHQPTSWGPFYIPVIGDHRSIPYTMPKTSQWTTFFDPHQLTFYLAYILTWMLTDILAFYLAFYRFLSDIYSILIFYLTYMLPSGSDILFGILSYFLSDIFSGHSFCHFI